MKNFNVMFFNYLHVYFQKSQVNKKCKNDNKSQPKMHRTKSNVGNLESLLSLFLLPFK